MSAHKLIFISNTRASGFSLLEILAAFSLAAVALALIFQIYARGTTAGILGDEYVRALGIAESRLELIGSAENFDSYLSSGVEGDKYHWEITLEDYLPAGPVSDLSRMELKAVTVTVSWDSRGQPRSISLQSLKPYYPS